jgi:antitoxin component YwqK of YwqJK toxin-antitoxin module
MKGSAFFLLLFFLPSVLPAQDTLNRTDRDGKKQGFWQKTDSAGKKIYEGQFRDGIPYGEFRYYYPNGKVKAVSVISGNGKNARTVTFFPGGRKMAEGIYREEKRDSTWRFYSEYDGSLLSEENYKEGKKDGISRTYYGGDGIAELTGWKDGMQEGPWEQYYSDGKLKLKGNYREGLRDGPVTTYFTSGKLLMEGQYVAGNADGTWTYYDETGIPEKREHYQSGSLIRTENLKPE